MSSTAVITVGLASAPLPSANPTGQSWLGLFVRRCRWRRRAIRDRPAVRRHWRVSRSDYGREQGRSRRGDLFRASCRQRVAACANRRGSDWLGTSRRGCPDRVSSAAVAADHRCQLRANDDRADKA